MSTGNRMGRNPFEKKPQAKAPVKTAASEPSPTRQSSPSSSSSSNSEWVLRVLDFCSAPVILTLKLAIVAREMASGNVLRAYKAGI